MNVDSGNPRGTFRLGPRSKRSRAASGEPPAFPWSSIGAQAIPMVQLMASSLRVDRSLATAVRFAAHHLEGLAGEALAGVDWAVRTRRYPSVEAGLRTMANELEGADLDLKRALMCLMEAENEPTQDGLERRLDRAYDLVVHADERRAERLARSLERPLTTLFGLGVVLPLVLVSLYPLLQVSMPGFGTGSLALILVIALPLAVFLGACHILDRNSIGQTVESPMRKVAAACAVAPTAAGACAWALALLLGAPEANDVLLAVAVAASAAGAAAGWVLSRRARGAELFKAAVLSDLPDLLHATGSRMVAGKSLEQSLFEAVESNRSTPLASRLRVVLFDVVIGRRSIEQALASSEELTAGGGVYPALRIMAAAAARDSSNAGRVTLQLAEFARRGQEAAETMRARLEAIVAQTRTTAVGFAPVILGITAGMFGLLGRAATASPLGVTVGAVTGGAGPFATLVVLFLSTQVVTADWLAARLLSSSPASTMGAHITTDVAVAMGLFMGAFWTSSAIF